MYFLNKITIWINVRIPLNDFCKQHLIEYYAPKNFNFWYFFGSLALFLFFLQFVSGIWLTMSYNPSSELAFKSVEYIMRDVYFGWIIRYMHSTGSSFFFIIIYFHIFRSLLYGSYMYPRELIWLSGMCIFICLITQAFFGYLLPWGNMSYWGAQVITSLFAAIPFVGDNIVEWIRGDYLISSITLNRFFSLHVSAIPVLFIFFIILHLISLHHIGSNNPEGVEIKKYKNKNGKPIDGIKFYPFYVIKDFLIIICFIFIFCFFIFFIPECYGYFLENINFIISDAMMTPEHIAPSWYMTPYYAILRSIPDKSLGILFMGMSILFMFLLPWLDKSGVKSIRYKGKIHKISLLLFLISFIFLGYLGMSQPNVIRTLLSQIFTIIYFLFFVFMPIYSKLDKIKLLPNNIK